jgi:hypothetical protein
MLTSTSTSTTPEKRATSPLHAMAQDPRYQQILGAVARGWCYSPNAHKPMDSDLALCIAIEVYKLGDTQ